MICKNCKTDFQGNFCNYCGQKADTRRLSSSYMINEVFESILQMNHGWLFTIKELSTRPGHSVREFLEGKRKQYFKPLAFLLLASTLYVLLSFLLGKETYLGGILSSIIEGYSSASEEDSILIDVLNWLANNFAYATLVFLPMFSFASYISFRKSQYNYVEHLVLNIYIGGYQILIYLVLAVLFYLLGITNGNADFIPSLSAIAYAVWVYLQFFEKRKVGNKIARIIQTYILNVFLIAIVILIISIFFIVLGIEK